MRGKRRKRETNKDREREEPNRKDKLAIRTSTVWQSHRVQ